MPREVRQRQNDSDEEDEVAHAIEDIVVQGNPEEAEGGSEEEKNEDDDDEVFEIERIIHHKNNHFGRGVRGYFVKWKGYPDAENSWVNENDCNAQDIIDEYWADFYAKRKTNAAGKRSRSSPLGDVEMVDDTDRPSKKSKKENMVKGVKPRSKPKKSEANGRTKFQTLNDTASDVMESTPTLSENVFAIDYKSMNDFMHLDNWEDIIDKVVTVDYASGAHRTVTYFFKMKNGEYRSAPGDAVRKRASSIAMDFYEANLRFQHAD